MVGAKPYPCRGRPLLPKPRRGGLFIEPRAIRFVLFFGGAARRLTELLRVTAAAPPKNKKSISRPSINRLPLWGFRLSQTKFGLIHPMAWVFSLASYG